MAHIKQNVISMFKDSYFNGNNLLKFLGNFEKEDYTYSEKYMWIITYVWIIELPIYCQNIYKKYIKQH